MTDDQLVARAMRGSRRSARVPAGQALGLYKRLRAGGELARHLVVEYRCADPAGCLLARVFTTREGTFVHKPAYRPTSGPLEHTPAILVDGTSDVDGASGDVGVVCARPESAYMLPSFPIALLLGCDHVRVRCDAVEVRADLALAYRRGSPTGRRIRATPTDSAANAVTAGVVAGGHPPG